MRLLCLGLSHKTAPIEIRERFALNQQKLTSVIRRLKNHWSAAEFVVISTCNRMEIYCARHVHDHPREQELLQFLAEIGDLDLLRCKAVIYTKVDRDAAEHLFAVAAGMDSMIVGENQIVRQIKQNYQLAVKLSAARAVMHDLFQESLHVAKHVRSETDISKGQASVAAAAVARITKMSGSLKGKTTLAIGAGEMSEIMVRQLAKMSPAKIIIANRTQKRCDKLARELGATVVSLASLGQSLRQADVVVCSAAAAKPLVTPTMLQKAKAANKRNMIIVDIAMPRNVDRTCENISGVKLINIDDLQADAKKTAAARSAIFPAARKIIRSHADDFVQSLMARAVAPTIAQLYKLAEKIADDELAIAANKFNQHEDAELDHKILRLAVHRIVRRMLDPMARNLRQSVGSDMSRSLVAAARRLFELDDDQPKLSK